MILGISISHASSAALIDMEGNIIATASEERFTRIKDESGFPKNAIIFLLKNINPKNITHVAFGAEFWKEPMPFFSFKKRVLENVSRDKFERNIFYTLICFLEHLGLVFKKAYPEEYFKNILGGLGINQVEVLFVDHHLAHAAGAYYTSNLDNPLIVTVDGVGDNKSASVNVANKNSVQVIYQAKFHGSPGAFYGLVTALCGFKPNRHEGKVTGLAAMGNSKAIPEMDDMLRLEKENGDLLFVCPLQDKVTKLLKFGAPLFGYEYIKWFIKRGTYEEFISKIEQVISRRIFADLVRKKYSRKDIAAGAQRVLEEKVVKFVEYYLSKFPKKSLILSGGVFANVKLNQRLFNIKGVENIFIHPGMGDEGTALGAAYQALSKIKPTLRPRSLKDVYLGPSYPEDEIKTEPQIPQDRKPSPLSPRSSPIYSQW
jgi:carbamoyltransferase